MTRNLTRARAAVAMLVVAVLVAAGARLATDATDRTSAAWTDDVHATTSVALGTWTPQLGTCTAVKLSTLEPIPGRPCTVVDVWGYEVKDSKPVGQRWAKVSIDVDSPGGWAQDLAFLVEIDLSAPGDAPDDWRFAGGWFYGSNLKPFATPCSTLPIATMLLPEWMANDKTYLEIDLWEAGAQGQGGATSCVR